MRAGLPQKEPELLARWQQLGLYERLRAAARGPAEIHPARRPALRQRQHPYRPRAQQDPQGRGDAQPADAGLRFELRAGLGLPRPADRVEDRGGVPRQGQEQGRGAGRRIPPRVPRLRRSTGSRCSARSSSGSASRATGPTPTPPWTSPPRRRSRARYEVRAERHALSRLEAGDVVGGGEDRARRGRGRVRGLRLRSGVGEVSGRRDGDPDRHHKLARRRGRHLDDDAVDHPRQPRDQLLAEDRVRALRSDRRTGGKLGQAGRAGWSWPTSSPSMCCSRHASPLTSRLA